MPTFEESVAAGGRQVGPVRNDPIEVVDADPAWPARFAEMRARLTEALGPTARRIDHVGSTAVPGLAAKPIVDIQLSVPDVEDEAAYLAPVEACGLVLRFTEPGHRYFRPPQGLPRLWHVHVCTIGSLWERDHLLFRDYLRAHPDEAAAYGWLKRELAPRFATDRIAYTDAKDPFIHRASERAETWARMTGWTVAAQSEGR
jgi:GrpB-like predicted nucleotidyltransferase (UPF0157 family)